MDKELFDMFVGELTNEVMNYDLEEYPLPLRVMQEHLRCAETLTRYVEETDYSEETLNNLVMLRETLEKRLEEIKNGEKEKTNTTREDAEAPEEVQEKGHNKP